jgi:hypothetical protein
MTRDKINKRTSERYDSNISNSEMNGQMMMIIPHKPSMKSTIFVDDSLLGHHTVYGAIPESITTSLLVKKYTQSRRGYKLV